jgi:hypothetical protein
MAQKYRWIAHVEQLPGSYECLPNFGIRIKHDFELPLGTYRLKLTAGNTYEPGQRHFRELAVLLALDKKFTFLEPVRLVRDLDPIPEADIAAQLRGLMLHPPQNALRSACSLEASSPEAVVHRGPGHPKDAEWRSWSFEYLLKMLKDGWKQARSKHPEKKRPSFDDVAACVGHKRRDLYDALKKYEHTWDTIRPFLVD